MNNGGINKKSGQGRSQRPLYRATKHHGWISSNEDDHLTFLIVVLCVRDANLRVILGEVSCLGNLSQPAVTPLQDQRLVHASPVGQ